MVKINWMTEGDIQNAMKEGIRGARTAFEYGIMNPRRNPIETAIASINAGIWEKNFKASIDKWVKELSKISLEQWKSAASASASTYADRAAGVGAKNWSEYYAKAKTTIEAAAADLVKSNKTKEDFIKFYESMSKLSEI